MTRSSPQPVSRRATASALCRWVAAAVLCWLAGAALPAAAQQFWQVQVGEFENADAARDTAVAIQNAGIEAVAVSSGDGYVVSAGIFGSRDNAERRRGQLAERGYERVRIVPYGKEPDIESAALEPGVLGEFVSLDKAKAAAERYRQRGRSVTVDTVRRSRQLQRLELGIFPNRRLAEGAVNRLEEQGFAYRLRRAEGRPGFIVSLGAFSDAQALERLRARLEELGFSRVRVTPTTLTQVRYRVVEQRETPPPRQAEEPPPAPVAGAAPPSVSAPAGPADEAAPASAPEEAPDAKRKAFLRRDEAERFAGRLREAGQSVALERETARLKLHSVQLRVYQRWANAQRAAGRLRREGYPTKIISDALERGYAVTTGAYVKRPDAERAARALRRLGFRNVQILPVRAPVTRYVVAPRPATPEGGEPKVAEAPVEAAQAEPAATVAKAPEAAGGQNVLVFGGASGQVAAGYEAAAAAAGESSQRGFHASVEDLWIEAGGLTDDATGIDGSHYLHAAGALEWRPNAAWTMRLGARVDGYAQTGARAFEDAELDYGETFVRYRGESSRFTLGAQEVLWGRVDEIAPTDRLATPDLRRYVLDDLPDRRLPSPAVRAEWFGQRYKLDVLVLPDLRAAELPEVDSIWHPVDREGGRLIGLEPDPTLAALIRNGTFGEDTDGAGGGGIRISRTGRAADVAFTAQRVRQLTPYYELDEGVRASLLAGNPVPTALASATGPTFVERHPWTTLVGADLGVPVGRSTWRFEVAWRSDVPVTAADLSMQSAEAVDWVAGVELYPGDGDARVNLQVAGQHLLDTPARILERDEVYTLNGELENVFAHARWRAGLRFFVGLDETDVYLNPEIAYVGLEPNEFYLGGHHFEGDPGTPGAFHEDHSLVVLGWRAQY